MKPSRTPIIFSDLGVLVLLALARLALHALTNGQYGFHRDELAILDDARHLAWGYVAYPPLLPFIARLSLELFGPSLVGLRFFSALAQSGVMLLSGLMARELGGSRFAQIVTALAVSLGPLSMIQGSVFQYVSFDYLWWVLIAYCTIRLLKSEDRRWWLGIGAGIGLGMLTKYAIAFFVVGLVGGIILHGLSLLARRSSLGAPGSSPAAPGSSPIARPSSLVAPRPSLVARPSSLVAHRSSLVGGRSSLVGGRSSFVGRRRAPSVQHPPRPAPGIAHHLSLVFTSTRRYLASRWLWGAVAIVLMLFVPNLVWLVQHNFISLEFLNTIHVRDVQAGRTANFLIEQFFVSANPLTIPLWIAGLYFYLFKPEGARYRTLGWTYVITFELFLITQGRSYYLAPAYPMLIAAGAVVWERWIASLPARKARLSRRLVWGGLVASALMVVPVMLPLSPVNSGLWNFASKIHDVFLEEIGWPELAGTVADIYLALPAEERSRTAILAGNYGEVGAISLYGPAYGLPEAISGVNSSWLRGYGNPPPQTLIVLGLPRQQVERYFVTCDQAGQVTNRYGVENEETRNHPDIFVCRGLREPWPDLWKSLRAFG